jgi:PA-IL-like protein
MNSTTPIVRGIVLMAVLAFVSASALADTIRLKDGSIIKGKIVRFSGGTFSVEIGEGARMRKMTFSVDEVESILFDSGSSFARVNQPAAKGPLVKVSDTTNSGNSGGPRVTPTDPVTPKTNDSTQSSGNSRVVTRDSTPAKTNDNTRASGNTSSEPKIIGTDATTIPKSVPPPAPKTTTTTSNPQPKVSAPQKSTAAGDPIELNVKVLADNTANGWTNSGWVVKKGQRIRITGQGEVNLGNGKKSSPAGLPDLADNDKLLKAVATGALIAVIGDDNNDFMYIGSEREFTASRDGTLFLGVNEGNLNDNSGSFNVKIQILPTGK